MKTVILACFITAVSLSANAKGGGGHSGGHTSSHATTHTGGHYTGTGSNPNSHHVNGYVKQDGHYVAPHYSTNPNATQKDNYNVKGNYNLHNGQVGTKYADH